MAPLPLSNDLTYMHLQSRRSFCLQPVGAYPWEAAKGVSTRCCIAPYKSLQQGRPAAQSPEALQEMQLSLETSFKSEGLGPSRFEARLQRKLHSLKALWALSCRLPSKGRPSDPSPLSKPTQGCFWSTCYNNST